MNTKFSGFYSEEGFYAIEMPIHEYELDRYEELRLSEFQKKMQEIASQDLFGRGYSHERLLELGFVYMTSWVAFSWSRPIVQRENLLFSTSHREDKGVRSFRDSWVTDHLGKRIAESSTAWVMVNPQTGGVLTPKEMQLPIKGHDRQISMKDAHKVRIRRDAPFLGEREIRYTDIDLNGHVNNCVYADIYCDFCKVDFSHWKFSRFDINYRAQVFEKDTLFLFGSWEEKEGRLFSYMHGLKGEDVCFVAEAQFAFAP